MTNGETIPSRALAVWRRLYTRYELEPFPASVGPDVSKTIVPVTFADELLAVPDIDRTTSGVIGLGNNTLRTVPAGERWELLAYEFTRNTNDRNIDGVRVKDPAGDLMSIDLFTASNERVLILTAPLILETSWQVIINIIGGTADGTWDSRLFVRKSTQF